MAVGTHDLQVK